MYELSLDLGQRTCANRRRRRVALMVGRVSRSEAEAAESGARSATVDAARSRPAGPGESLLDGEQLQYGVEAP